MYKYVAWLIQCPSAGPCVINKCNAAMVLFSKPQGVDIHLPIWANYMLPSAKPRSGAPIPVNLKLEHTALFFFLFFSSTLLYDTSSPFLPSVYDISARQARGNEISKIISSEGSRWGALIMSR